MLKVRTFYGNATREGMKYFDEHINSWIMENKADIRMTNLTFGDAKVGMSGSKEPCLLAMVWYDTE